MVLNVENINVSIKSKEILRDVTFSAKNGELLAIMGPSGSGKTMILNTISGRQARSSGNVTLSGKHMSKPLMQKIGFVPQENEFFSRLTLWDTLYFTAMLRIPECIPNDEKLKRVNDVIDMLDLRKCVNTVMGDMFIRGLSGGEKKRAGIACELLTDPNILLVDEPTSGLDSFTAHSLMAQLKKYAHQYNKTVVVSIHQPSSQIYFMFDSLLLIALGKTVYFGDAHVEPLNYFDKMGHHCGEFNNPADFMLDIVKSLETKIESMVFVNSVRNKEERSDVKTDSFHTYSLDTHANLTDAAASDITANTDPSTTVDIVDSVEINDDTWPTSFTTQFKLLYWRNSKQSRGRILYLYDVVQCVLLSVIAGILFFQIPTSSERFRDRMGLVFFMTTYWTFDPAIRAIVAFPSEIGIVSKERAVRAYRLSSYYFSKTVSEIQLLVLLPTFFYTSCFWMAGLSGVKEFFTTLPILLLNVVSAQGLGLLLGALISNIKVSLNTCNTLILISLLFSGFITQTFPTWMHWAKYFSMIHYTISAISIITLNDMEHVSCKLTAVANFPKCIRNSSEFVTSEDVLLDAGIDLPVYWYICMMLGVLIISRVATYYALRVKYTQLK